MQRLVLAVLVCIPLAALAGEADPQFSGSLGDNDTATFFVRPTSDNESWWFKIPDGDYFWVKTQDSTGREYQDTDLSDHQSVTLVGAKGKKVVFRIYEIAGEGAWSAWKGSGPAAANEDAVFAVAKPTMNAQPAPGQLLKPGDDGKFSGYLDEDDSTSFAVKPESDLEHWRFQIPDGKYFWLKVMIDGVERDDIDLSDYGSVTLKNAKGQDMILTIYQIGGVGEWSAWKSASAADEDHVFDLTGETSDGEIDFDLDDEALYEALAELFAGEDSEGLTGSLAEGASDTITVTTESESEEWVFAIPDGAKFKVKVLAANGDVLRDVDLAQSNRITLEGKGEHKLVIRSKSGSGDWSARKAK